MDRYGKQDLLDYLKRHDEGLTLSDALKFLKHSTETAKYRALRYMIEQGQIQQTFRNKVSHITIGPQHSLTVPELMPWSLQPGWPSIFGAIVKLNVQQPHLPVTRKVMDAARHLLKYYENDRKFLNLLTYVLNADLNQADYIHIEKQLPGAGFNYDPSRDIYVAMPSIVALLKELGAERVGISEEELETLKSFDNREPLHIEYPEAETA